MKPFLVKKEWITLLSTLFLWQGRQDSNPQPMVLETTTLPIELLPYNAFFAGI